MSQPLLYLTNIAIILLLGIILSLVAKRLKISNLLLLVLCGIVLNKISAHAYAITFDPVFLTSISILALVMIVFDSCTRFKLKELDEFSILAIKSTLIWLVLNLILMTFAVLLIFDKPSLLMALMFAALMSGTAPAAVLVMFRGTEHRLAKFLEVEAIVNTPIIVLLPFIILDLIGRVKVEFLLTSVIEQIGPFLQQFVAGIGAGILVGIVGFKIISSKYPEAMGPLTTMTASLLTYILAENLGGSGVLAVTTLGLFFGYFFKRETAHLIEYSSMFANTLVILVFVLIGLSVDIPFTFTFFGKSLLLFVIYLLLRYVAILISFKDLKYKVKEKIFMALNAQKGIASATVAFSLTTMLVASVQIIEGVEGIGQIPFISLPGAKEMLSLIVVFIIYSLLVSTIIQRISKFFIGEIIIPEATALEGTLAPKTCPIKPKPAAAKKGKGK